MQSVTLYFSSVDATIKRITTTDSYVSRSFHHFHETSDCLRPCFFLSDGDATRLPCEFCHRLFATDDLIQHEVGDLRLGFYELRRLFCLWSDLSDVNFQVDGFF